MPTALKGISAEAMWGLLGKTEEDVKEAQPKDTRTSTNDTSYF
jgi:hypothetical protein